MPGRDELDEEHERLKRAIEDLRREHERLRQNPDDVTGHQEHRQKLEMRIAELRAHLARLKER